jgi:hypothetical protein
VDRLPRTRTATVISFVRRARNPEDFVGWWRTSRPCLGGAYRSGSRPRGTYRVLA